MDPTEIYQNRKIDRHLIKTTKSQVAILANGSLVAFVGSGSKIFLPENQRVSMRYEQGFLDLSFKVEGS